MLTGSNSNKKNSSKSQSMMCLAYLTYTRRPLPVCFLQDSLKNCCGKTKNSLSMVYSCSKMSNSELPYMSSKTLRKFWTCDPSKMNLPPLKMNPCPLNHQSSSSRCHHLNDLSPEGSLRFHQLTHMLLRLIRKNMPTCRHNSFHPWIRRCASCRCRHRSDLFLEDNLLCLQYAHTYAMNRNDSPCWTLHMLQVLLKA